MKKNFISLNIFIILLLSIILLSGGCSKDDDNKEDNKTEVPGGEDDNNDDGSKDDDKDDENDDNDDNNTDINVIDKIKDPYFKAYIKLSIELGRIKTADKNILTPAEAAVVSELSLANAQNKKEITSLEGIKYFTGIEKLHIQDTGVSLLDLTNNKKITYIKISGCTAESMKIISPSVKEIYGKYGENISLTLETPVLDQINCSDSKLKNLDVTACPKLTRLNCGGAKIISLDVSKNPELYLLWCGGYGCITSGQLDVSNNKKLEFLSCDQGAGAISKLYVWWEGGRDNRPQQLQGSDKTLGTKFIVNTKTQIIKK